jgi:hypothetical protein
MVVPTNASQEELNCKTFRNNDYRVSKSNKTEDLVFYPGNKWIKYIYDNNNLGNPEKSIKGTYKVSNYEIYPGKTVLMLMIKDDSSSSFSYVMGKEYRKEFLFIRRTDMKGNPLLTYKWLM